MKISLQNETYKNWRLYCKNSILHWITEKTCCFKKWFWQKQNNFKEWVLSLCKRHIKREFCSLLTETCISRKRLYVVYFFKQTYSDWIGATEMIKITKFDDFSYFFSFWHLEERFIFEFFNLKKWNMHKYVYPKTPKCVYEKTNRVC